jgi:glycosyltransferase involved in cell wall biosynthesis
VIARRRLDRLLVPLPSARMGGTERHTAELCTRLARRTGMRIDLAAEPALTAALAPHCGPGVALHDAALGWEEADAADRQATEVARLVAALRPDAAFIALPWPAAAPGLLPPLAALPRLVLLHLAPADPVAAPPPGLEGAVLAAVARHVAARGAASWGVPETAFALLANPAPAAPDIDRAAARATLRAALGLPADAPLLLFLGRLEEAKGADLLPDISDRLPATLAVAGEGPLRGFLDARAAADPRGLLRMLGALSDPAPWYLAADALLMPSRLEGAPLVFLEAAAHRCPVVATPAALEGLGADAPRCASLAATPDARGMAEAAEAVLADAAGVAPRVEAAAVLAARQSWDAAVDETLGLLRAAWLHRERSAA